jgi:hypothetical protein
LAVEILVIVVTILVLLGVTGFLIGALIRSIRRERRTAGVARIWRNFGLSIAFCTLFLTSWAAQALAEWREFVVAQQAHQEPVEVGDFLVRFGQSTLENWQSEFLQLFSFVVLSAVLLHHGSPESRDSDDRIEETLRRIERRLEEMAH